MIPKILHQLWKTAAIPARFETLRQSWLARHPTWEYRLWTDADIAAFVTRDFPELLPVFEGYAQPICRADLARYLILKRHGGLYVDLDFECFKPIDGLLGTSSFAIGLEPASHLALGKAVQRRMERVLCPSLIASVPEHPFWDHVLGHIRRNAGEADVLDATGPFLLTRAYEDYRGPEPVTLLPAETVYPVDKMECLEGRLFDIAHWEAATRDAHALHHWDGTWFLGEAAFEAKRPRRLRLNLSEGSGPLAGAAEPSDNRPLVSCLMVTRDRFEQARLSIDCFLRQSYPNRQLVIIDDSRDDRLVGHVAALGDPRIVIERSPTPAPTLGEARNRAVDLAKGSHVCQWDDDDLYDPLRLELQVAALLGARARACMLSRWTIWWPDAGRLAISGRRAWEGSLLCEKAVLPRYPALRRGEDTPAVDELLRTVRVAHLDEPRLYLYVAHGRNTFGGDHFDAHWESAAHRWLGERYRAVLAELAKRLPLDAYARLRPPAPSRPNTGRGAAWERILSEATAILDANPANPSAKARRAGALMQLDRLEEAEAAFRDLCAAHPKEPFGLDGLARVAARRRQWLEALKRWEATLAAFPEHWPGMLGYAQTLLDIGRFEEAEALFAEVARRQPQPPLGAIGLAEAAARRRDWETARQRWQTVLAHTPTSAQAIVGLLTALCELGRLNEAEKLLADSAPHLGRADTVLARAMLLQRRHHGAALLALLDEHLDVVEANPTLRNLYFHAAQTTHGDTAKAAALLAPPEPDGALPAWAQAVACAHAPQGIGEGTRAQLIDLWHRHGLAILSPDLLTLIAEAVAQAEGPAGVEAILKAVDGMPLTDVRAVKMRLLAVFERLRREGGDDAATALRALAASGDPRIPLGHWREAVRGLVDMVQRLRDLYPAFDVDTGWRRSQAEAVVARILDSYEARRPFSLIRLGDGEGNFLPYPAEHAAFAEADRAATQCIWWGEPRLTGAAADVLSDALQAAVRNADVVGIPDLSRLCYSLPVPTAADLYHSWHDYRGLLTVIRNLLTGGNGLFAPTQAITSCHIHADLSAWGLYERLFATIRRVAVVTCHPTLPERLAERFGLTVSRVHLIPHETKYGGIFRYGEREPHFPTAYERLMETLTVDEPGQVVLVAAGFLGKMYCKRIKEQGGIALDLGSVVDYWCGFTTRSLHFTQRYAAIPAPAPKPEHKPEPKPEPEPGPNAAVFGHLCAPVGLGTAALGTLEALAAAGVPTTAVDLDRPAPAARVMPDHPVTIVHTNPDALLDAARWGKAGPLSQTLFQDRLAIGCWAWESSTTFPESWRRAYALFDEIWVPSRFAAESLAVQAPVPVVVMPHVVAPPVPALTRRDLGLPETGFLFAFSFDELSGFTRKNPLGLIEAFKQAFPQDDGRAVLVIKARTLSAANRARLLAAAEGRPSIILREGSESREAALALLATCDAYVSLHRSEGFGLTIAEAMHFAKPVIATGYSGNLDFMAPDCAYSVPYRLITTEADEGYYPRGTLWAEPDLSVAADLLRTIAAEPEEAREVGRRAAAHVRATLSAEAVGKRMRERIAVALEHRRAGDRLRRPVAVPLAAPQCPEPPTVLVLTPVKNARRHLPAYLAALDRLDHPRDRLSLAFLEGDSEDGSSAYLDGRLEELRTRYRRVELHRHDFGVRLSGPRWKPEVQGLRRATIARARNRLLTGALRDEQWALWIDADVVDFPPDVLTRLLDTGHDIVTPNCVTEPGGPSFDLNSFQFTDEAAATDPRHWVNGLIQPPRGVGRRYLHELRGQGPVRLDGVGGTMLLVRAALHREGLVFPAFSYRGYIETEGLAMMAKDMGVSCWGLPDVEILHVRE
ncbi:glycosyltransferase [Azospirillum soli]|uniref:glycosyltransferase n=1 Tax=Azospirillum soli TaxID=1304799 RepID=UPI001AE90333|nr:glycosyltransferase involved in cell wall biosynthesis/Flp pilus assembly protein TadD [Azospirillum soli]